jgi:transcription elongation factor GreB
MTKQYISLDGYNRFSKELDQLLRVERPKIVEIVSWAAGNGDRSENGDYQYGKKRLREIDRRVHWLTKRLDSAKVVDTSKQNNQEKIYFGATVTYVDEDDISRTVTILGDDESDFNRGEVSLSSPIAKALLGNRLGATIKLQTPNGIEEIEITEVKYS